MTAPERPAAGIVTPEDFDGTESVLPDVWPGSAVAIIDLLGLASSIVLAAFVFAGTVSIARAIDALVFFIVVPGWSILRAFRVRPCSLSLMGAVALSIALLLIVGEVLVTRLGFPWRGTTILACGCTALVLLIALSARRWR